MSSKASSASATNTPKRRRGDDDAGRRESGKKSKTTTTAATMTTAKAMSVEEAKKALAVGLEVTLHCTKGGASKFWTVTVDGEEVVVVFGKIGSAGQERIADKGSTAAALDHAIAQLESKVQPSKGYVIVSASGGEAAAAAAGGKEGEPDAESIDALLERISSKKPADLTAATPGVTRADIDAFEAQYKRKLPALYASILQITDGMILALNAVPADPNPWANDHAPVNTLASLSQLGGTDEDAEEWELPDDMQGKILMIDGDGHEWIILDYTRPNTAGEPTVAYILQESDPEWKRFRIADSFADLLSRLYKVNA